MRDEDGLYIGYNQTAATVLGIFQFILGVGSLTVGIICIFQLTSFGFVGHGIWCGTMFIVSGGVVIAAGTRPADHVVIAGTVFSSVCAALSLAQIGLSSYGLYCDMTQTYCKGNCSNDPFLFCTRWINGINCMEQYDLTVSVLLQIFLVGLAVVAFAFALASACLICECCTKKVNKIAHSEDDLRKSIPATYREPPPPPPPSKSRMTDVNELEEIKSNRGGTSHASLPQEWKLSYAN